MLYVALFKVFLGTHFWYKPCCYGIFSVKSVVSNKSFRTLSAEGRQGYSLEVRREHDGGPEQRSFFDLPAETENSILLEALTNVQDVLILQRDETDLL